MAEFIKDKNGTAYNVQHITQIYCNDQYCEARLTQLLNKSYHHHFKCEKDTPCYNQLLSYHTPIVFHKGPEEL